MSHKINKLAFGDYFPGAVNPLDGYYSLSFLITSRVFRAIVGSASSLDVLGGILHKTFRSDSLLS